MAEQPIRLNVAAGEYMESATLIEWLKKPGESIEEGQPVAVVETAKASMDVEASSSGTILRLEYDVDDEVPIGAVLCWIETGELSESKVGDTHLTSMDTGTPSSSEAVPARSLPTSDRRGQAPSSESLRRIIATPIARRIAEDLGVDLRKIKGSGPRGRITEQDVRTAPDTHDENSLAVPDAAESPYEVLRESGYRRTTAQRMIVSAEIPQFHLTIQLEMTALLAVRSELSESDRPTITAILVKAVAEVLNRHPRLNAVFVNGEVRHYFDTNIAVAVATDEGLAAPVIRGANNLSVTEINQALIEKRTRATQRRLDLEDVSDGTFTISSLGATGIVEFAALVNPPQAAILAVGSLHPAWVIGAAQPRLAPCCMVTLSCDHRAVDGADGAKFLQTLKSVVANPTPWWNLEEGR